MATALLLGWWIGQAHLSEQCLTLRILLIVSNSLYMLTQLKHMYIYHITYCLRWLMWAIVPTGSQKHSKLYHQGEFLHNYYAWQQSRWRSQNLCTSMYPLPKVQWCTWLEKALWSLRQWPDKFVGMCLGKNIIGS